MPALPPLTEALSDGDVRLRDSAERDIPEVLIAYEDDRTMHERLFEERPPTGAGLGRAAETAAADRAAGCRATVTVLSGDSDVCLGQLRVHDVEWEHARAELSLWIAPRARGRGLGATALRLGGAWLLASCGLARLQLLVEPDNGAMRRAAVKAGFHEEGRLREHLRRGERRVDVLVMSLVAEDLEAGG